eukprot:3213571-Amphidinium_carterae.1
MRLRAPLCMIPMSNTPNIIVTCEFLFWRCGPGVDLFKAAGSSMCCDHCASLVLGAPMVWACFDASGCVQGANLPDCRKEGRLVSVQGGTSEDHVRFDHAITYTVQAKREYTMCIRSAQLPPCKS